MTECPHGMGVASISRTSSALPGVASASRPAAPRRAAGKLQPVDHPAAGVQRQHTPAVLANQLLLADRWGQPCRAYNVCIRPGPAAAAALAALQARALRLEPSLLRVPERALHISLAWLLPVHQEFDRPKDELWQRHGPQWLATLAEAAGRTSRFAWPSGTWPRPAPQSSPRPANPTASAPCAVSCYRCCTCPAAEAPGDLADITLFRYARPLHDPASLLRWLAATQLSLDIEASELLVIRERIFPSLDYEILHHLPLAPASPAR